jgi:GNAT superfamily N-acetyltransferase
MPALDLPNGYYDLPPGKLANIVTCLEMRMRPQQQNPVWPEGYNLQRINPDDTKFYVNLFQNIGRNLMWFSRLIMSDEKLKAILSNPQIESFALMHGQNAIGLLELNFEAKPNCELTFFGLVKDAVGTGLGRQLMAEAINRAWAKPINRFWVHTCHYDHPRAVAFYLAAGFTPYALMVEVHDDPRLSGHLPMDASPHIALISP